MRINAACLTAITLACLSCQTSPEKSAPPPQAATSPATSPPSSAPPTVASPAPAVSSAPVVAEQPEGPKVPDVVYVPTPRNVVDKMLQAAAVKKTDVVYDLGCGDGRILVTAAKRFGARGFGFDVDPARIAEATANVKKEKVEHLVSIEQKDIFEVDLSPATVVTLYLLPELNVRLVPQLQKLKDGARVVSHDFDMAGVKEEKSWTLMAPDHDDPKKLREHYVFLWRAPIRLQASSPAASAAP
jgi:SAM-dependent methyltransferase